MTLHYTRLRDTTLQYMILQYTTVHYTTLIKPHQNYNCTATTATLH